MADSKPGGATEPGSRPKHRLSTVDAEDAVTPLRSLGRELARSHRCFETRVHDLEAATDSLRREVNDGARRLKDMLEAIAAAEERAGHAAAARGLRQIVHPSSSADETVRGNRSGPGNGPPECLTGREQQVLRLVTDGCRSPQIAVRLGVRVGTIEVHRRNIMRKIGEHSIAGLTRFPVRSLT